MKLEGLKVLDLGLFLPTPVISQMMADHGADVIAVEPPGGDPTRHLAGKGNDGESLWYDAMHRGKRSIVADLKVGEDRDMVLRLAREADVFIESFRPGVTARLGIGAELLCEANPRLIHCSLSAYGQTGPLAALPGHDLAIQAQAGFISLNRHPGEPPIVPSVPAADMAGGMTALAAILMALYRREHTGLGEQIDIAMYDSLLAWTPHFQTFAAAFGEMGQGRLQQAISGSAFYNVYATQDGKAIVLAGPEPHYVRNFLKAIDREELAEAAMQDPGPTQDRVIAEFRKVFVTRTFAQWCALLDGVNISWAPVLDMAEAFRHPHAFARKIIAVGAGATSPATPFKFSHEPGVNGRPAPMLDEHGSEISRLGFAWSSRTDREG